MDILEHVIGALNAADFVAYAEVPEAPQVPYAVVNLVGMGGRPWIRNADLSADCYGATMLASSHLATRILKFLDRLSEKDDDIWHGALVTITNEMDGERRLPCYRLDYTLSYKDFA